MVPKVKEPEKDAEKEKVQAEGARNGWYWGSRIGARVGVSFVLCICHMYILSELYIYIYVYTHTYIH